MGSELEEYWDGVDGPAERQVSSEFSCFPWLVYISLCLPAQAGIALDFGDLDVN